MQFRWAKSNFIFVLREQVSVWESRFIDQKDAFQSTLKHLRSESGSILLLANLSDFSFLIIRNNKIGTFEVILMDFYEGWRAKFQFGTFWNFQDLDLMLISSSSFLRFLSVRLIMIQIGT